jgi:hypothetical protein
MRIIHTTWFNCPAARLWPFLDEPERQKLWLKGLLSNELTSEGPVRPGSTFRMCIQEGRKVGTYDGEITAHEPPRHLGLRFWGGALPAGLTMQVDYRLSEEGGRTRLDYEANMEGRCGFFLRLLLPLVKVFSKMQLRSFLKTLKRLAEAPERSE